MKKISLWRTTLLLSLVASLSGRLPAAVTTYTEPSSASGANWSASTTWSKSGGDAPSLFPNRAGDVATYGTTSTTTSVILDTSVTVGMLKVSTGTWSIASSPGAVFTLDNTGGGNNTFGNTNAAISHAGGSGSLTVNPSILLQNTNLDIGSVGASISIVGDITAAAASAQTISFRGTGAGSTSISGNIGASGGSLAIQNLATSTGTLTISSGLGANVTSITSAPTGAATIVLSGANTSFTGGVTITSGTVRLSNAAALGLANTITMNGGTLDYNVNNTIQGLNGSGSVLTSGAGNRVLTLGGSGNYNYTGIITNTSPTQSARTGLTVALTGTGTQTLSGDSVFSGGTTISSGTLFVNNTTGSGLGTGVVTLNGGTLAGTGTIAGATTAAAGAFLAPGASSAPSLLTFGSSLNIAAMAGGTNGSLLFDLAATGDQIALTSGVLTIGAGVLDFADFNFATALGFAPGNYTLFDTTQAISGTLGSSLTGTINGFSASLGFGDGGHDLVLTVVAVPEPTTMALAISGVLGIFLLGRRRLV